MENVVKNFAAENKEEDAVIRALSRAYDRGAHALIFDMHSAHGRATALYGTDLFSAYRVQVAKDCTDCSCRAGQARMLCLHVAALADKAGMLDVLIPDFYARAFGSAPVDPAPAVTIVELEACPDCHGDGYRRSYYGGHFSDWYAIDCHTCAKTGKVSRELVAA